MRARARTLRAIALLAAGSAAVHQLRYAIGYGPHAGHALTAQGHAYLDLLLPFLAALALVALAWMVRAPIAAAPGRRLSLRRTWATAFAALVGAYFAQELLEGVFAAGHPTGLAGVLGSDGWTAIVLAAPISLLVALGLRGDEALAPRALGRMRARPVDATPFLAAMPAAAPVRPALAGPLPARGPPLLRVA